MTKAIYPEIEVRTQGSNTTLLTAIRKEHNGKWYLWQLIKNFNSKDNVKVLQSFHKEAYFILMCGEVSELITDAKGEPIYKEDSNQISEKHRIRKIVKSWFTYL